MFSSFSDGFCPQCLLDNREIVMNLNRQDLWECPCCHLQGAGRAGGLMLLNVRGSGTFRQKATAATDFIVGALLTKQKEDDPLTPGGAFTSETEFRELIRKIESSKKDDF